MQKIRYRDCRIGDVIEVSGPCRIVVQSKSGKAPRLQIIASHDSDIDFNSGEQAHTCRDTNTTLTKGE